MTERNKPSDSRSLASAILRRVTSRKKPYQSVPPRAFPLGHRVSFDPDHAPLRVANAELLAIRSERETRFFHRGHEKGAVFLVDRGDSKGPVECERFR